MSLPCISLALNLVHNKLHSVHSKQANLALGLVSPETDQTHVIYQLLQTGTLTENRMTVVEGWFAGKKYDQVPQPGDLPPGFFDMFQASIAVNSSVRGLASIQALGLHCLIMTTD